jgi:hypothetical protein
MGIYGPWGDGKSSTLALIKEALNKQGGVVQVDYNPWLFSSTIENLTRSFFLTLGDALERTSLFSRDKVGSLLKKYGGIVPKFGSLLKAAGDALSVTDLRETRSQVEAILTRHKTPIVVFVDDIDRLDRTEIQALFKLIRLSADFPYVIYVLAFDDEIVAAALGEAYENGDAAAGRRFLEKIIQAPLHLPKASSVALRTMAFEGVDAVLKSSQIDLPEADVYAFGNNFALSFETLMTTPRQVKLYENALTFAVPILATEVNLVDLLLLEGIRTFIPKLYLAIRDNPELFLKSHRGNRDQEKRMASIISDSFAKMVASEEVRASVRSHVLERLFPRISSMGYGDEWNAIWAKEKHICVEDYFPRYFRYGVPVGDIADQLIDELLLAASRGELPKVNASFSTVKSQKAYPAFIRKLRIREEAIPEAAAPTLVRALSQNSKDLPREPSSMLTDWTIMQAGILTSHLVQKIQSPQMRLQVIQSAISESDSLVYAVNVLQWTRRTEEKGESHGFLEEGEISALTQIVVEKLMEAAQGTPLYRFLGNDTPRVLLTWSWHGDQKALRNNVEKSVATEGAEGAEYLIQMCCGKSWEMQTGIPSVSDVRRNVYDTVGKFADPEIIMGVLKKRYGSKLDNPSFYPGRDVPLGERLAIQFAYIHQHPKSEEADGTETNAN